MEDPQEAQQQRLFDVDVGMGAPPAKVRREKAQWPDYDRFPYNDRRTRHTVKSVVQADLARSRAPLIVTGYTLLDQIITFLASYHQTDIQMRSVRVILGHEPHQSPRKEYRRHQQRFDEAIESYWLEWGIALYRSADVFAALQVLEQTLVEVRILAHASHPIHAKIFMGDDAITLGSSNYSRNGLEQQIETNERHTRDDYPRFSEARQLAEKVWTYGCDYKAGLQTLLQDLLCEVHWHEALARACAELLDGTWARRYKLPQSDMDTSLWPAQQQGLAQAMWIMEDVGSVLIADAAGSGKTVLGASVLQAVVNRVWGRGTMRNPMPLLIVPSKTHDAWETACIQADVLAKVYTHGQLHHLDDLWPRTQVLAVDEAHNFLNPYSQRTKMLLRNSADHVILLTATPINTKATDLISIINLLGPDNFEEEALTVTERLLQSYGLLNRY